MTPVEKWPLALDLIADTIRLLSGQSLQTRWARRIFAQAGHNNQPKLNSYPNIDSALQQRGASEEINNLM